LLSDKFHTSTNIKKLGSRRKNTPKSWIDIHYKTYPRLDRFAFPSKIFRNNHIEKLLKKRKTIRQFTKKPISKEDLIYILFMSNGLIRPGKNLNEVRRSYPSAGARYPLEIYPLILNCKGFNRGLYHYNLKRNLLELLIQKNLTDWLIKKTGNEKWLKKASVIFIITGVLDRTRIKYGDRGYRYILIETGHLAQNMILITTALGLGTCPIGGFVDDEVNKLLDINLQKEVVLYLIAIGTI